MWDDERRLRADQPGVEYPDDRRFHDWSDLEARAEPPELVQERPRPALRVLPDPEPAVVSRRPDLNPDGTARDGWWSGQGQGKPPLWVDRPQPTRLDTVRSYLQRLADVLRDDVAEAEQQLARKPWEP